MTGTAHDHNWHENRCTQDNPTSASRSGCGVAAAQASDGAPHRRQSPIDRKDTTVDTRRSVAHPCGGRDRRPRCSNTANRLKGAAFPVIKTLECFDVSASSTSATTRGSLTFSRMSASRTGNDTPTQRGAPQCGYPSFVGGTACTGGDLTHYCCGGTVHLVEMAIDPVVTLFCGTCWCTT